MANNQRVEALEKSCKRLNEALEHAEACKDELISLKEEGMSVFERGSDGDQFPSLIEEANNVIKIYERILRHMEDQRDKAKEELDD